LVLAAERGARSQRGYVETTGGSLRFAVYGLLLAAVLFIVTGGHLLFLPLFFVLPLGGLFGHRRRHGRL
jgi:hypothetical protein